MKDERATRFEVVAREVLEPVRRFLVRRTDSATADDVLSETLLVLWRRLDDVPPEEVMPWTYGVARNCLANAERGVRRQQRVAEKVARLDPPEHAAEIPSHDETLAAAMASLTETETELIRLWAWEQLTPKEIARVLEITPNAVSIRLHRAREKLAAELRKEPATAGHEESERGRDE